MKKYKVAVVTCTRAEYGLSKKLLDCIHTDEELELCLIVSGSHLSYEHGYTVQEIEADGFPVQEKIDILLTGDTPAAVSKTMGVAFISFADMFERQKPDILLVEGDRYELIPICFTAVNAHIPIVHVSGGEVTEGAVDDMVRHCVTKMSCLHFPACEAYRKRIIQMGEEPATVFNYGDIGAERVLDIQTMSKKELEISLGISLERPYAVVTVHPVTVNREAVTEEIDALLDVIEAIPEMLFLFTKANADAGGAQINERIEAYCQTHENAVLYDSLGMVRYISALKYSEMVIGNSSSSIVEAPLLHIPSIDIGNRQKGRLKADSVIEVQADKESILHALKKAQSKEFLQVVEQMTPIYQGEQTAKKIVEEIKKYLKTEKMEPGKKFYDISL